MTEVQLDALRDGLCGLGYVEGRNAAIEYRWAEGKAEPLAGLAGELMRLGVDVILATNSLAAFAAKNATNSKMPAQPL